MCNRGKIEINLPVCYETDSNVPGYSSHVTIPLLDNIIHSSPVDLLRANCSTTRGKRSLRPRNQFAKSFTKTSNSFLAFDEVGNFIGSCFATYPHTSLLQLQLLASTTTTAIISKFLSHALCYYAATIGIETGEFLARWCTYHPARSYVSREVHHEHCKTTDQSR